MPYAELKELAAGPSASGGAELEAAWMAAIASPDADFAALVPVLETLRDKGDPDAAELFAWSALAEARERLSPRQFLPIASAMLLALDQSDELRTQVAEAFQRAYPDVPYIAALIDRCGLADGSKSARRALRTLEVCLAAKPGGYLLSRRDETVAQVVSADADADRFLVLFAGTEHGFSGDELAAEFAPADDDDFRVLERFRRDRLAELLEKDPAALVIAILKSRGRRLDQDSLRYLLTPRYLAADAWPKWWSRARTAVKRERCVRIEGRAPVALIYDVAGTDPESEAWAALSAARTPSKLLAACESYFRQCRAIKQTPKPDFLVRAAKEIAERTTKLRRAHAADAWATALLADWLADQQPGAQPDTPKHAIEFLKTIDDPAELLLRMHEPKLWPAAVSAVREVLGDDATDAFVRILPRAAEGMCDQLAQAVLAAGQTVKLNDLAARICGQPVESIEALAWLWKGPKAAGAFDVPPPVELLARMLDALAQISREPETPGAVKTKVRRAVKGALSAQKHARFDACLSQIDESMASAIRRRIERADGLGVTTPAELLELIRKRFPALWAKPAVAPWQDESVIYVTAEGLQKREKEIDRLVNVDMVENARAIGEAAAHGDLSENAEYRFALERRDMLRSRLAVMQDQMLKARVLERHDVPTDHVGVGSRVHLVPADGGDAVEMTLLGPWEADPAAGVYNYKAPLCKELLGRKPGDTVHLALDADDRPYRIDRIESGI